MAGYQRHFNRCKHIFLFLFLICRRIHHSRVFCWFNGSPLPSSNWEGRDREGPTLIFGIITAFNWPTEESTKNLILEQGSGSIF